MINHTDTKSHHLLTSIKTNSTNLVQYLRAITTNLWIHCLCSSALLNIILRSSLTSPFWMLAGTKSWVSFAKTCRHFPTPNTNQLTMTTKLALLWSRGAYILMKSQILCSSQWLVRKSAWVHLRYTGKLIAKDMILEGSLTRNRQDSRMSHKLYRLASRL